MHRHELDLLICGFSATHHWRAEVGQTFIYFNERNQQGTLGEHVILTAPGENALLLTLERVLFTRRTRETYLPRFGPPASPRGSSGLSAARRPGKPAAQSDS